MGRPIGNFGGATCGGTLFPIMQASCNSAFAEMGAEDAGADAMTDTAQAFGFNQDVPIDLPAARQLVVPRRVRERFAETRAGVHRSERRASHPLQMALVAAAVANGGES